MAAHALLSASGAHRWMNCPASARWEATLPEPPEKDYTREGTLAHAIGELQLLKVQLKYNNRFHGEETIHQIHDIDIALAELKKDPLYTQAMWDYVAAYTEHVEGLLFELSTQGKYCRVFPEVKLDLSDWIPEGFGTSDCVIISDDEMYVIDLKYGKGTLVIAHDNPQLRAYALGAWKVFSDTEDISAVHLNIFQPRMDNYDAETMPLSDLLEWGSTTLKPAAERAWKGEGGFCPGTHCKFCKGRVICQYNAAYMLEMGQLDLQAGPELTPTQIAGVLERVGELQKWATEIKEYALESALTRGVKYPGYKVVRGRANRRITDEGKAVALLSSAGYGVEQTCSLKGLTELGKVVGVNNLNKILESVIEKPEGKPTLVPDTDKREALEISTDEYGLE